MSFSRSCSPRSITFAGSVKRQMTLSVRPVDDERRHGDAEMRDFSGGSSRAIDRRTMGCPRAGIDRAPARGCGQLSHGAVRRIVTQPEQTAARGVQDLDAAIEVGHDEPGGQARDDLAAQTL